MTLAEAEYLRSALAEKDIHAEVRHTAGKPKGATSGYSLVVVSGSLDAALRFRQQLLPEGKRRREGTSSGARRRGSPFGKAAWAGLLTVLASIRFAGEWPRPAVLRCLCLGAVVFLMVFLRARHSSPGRPNPGGEQ